MAPVDRVVDALRSGDCNPRRSGNGWQARCPAHDDRKPSLHVTEGADGRALLHCHAGCPAEAVLGALGLDMSDLFMASKPKQALRERQIVATFPYVDENGAMLYEAVRYTPKDFCQRRPDGDGGWLYKLDGVRRVPYRLPDVREAIDNDRWVVLVEGEKCADRLARENVTATTTAGGAKSWRDGYAQQLAGAKVAILPDNDPPGWAYAEAAAMSLRRVAKTVRVVDLDVAEKGDVFDWLESGHTLVELRELVESAPEWEPPARSAPDGVYLVRASDLSTEDVDYLEDDLIPLRVVTLVTGLDGVGKSTILYHKGALATRGKLPGRFKGEPVDVVVASCEDHPESVIKPRLMAAGADLQRVHVVKVRRDGLTGDISLPDDLDAVALKVGGVNARLLLVDPLVAHMPLHIDSHKAQHVRSVLAPLARLAEERELAVAAVVHFNGLPSIDVRSRISGSKALRDAARSVLVCGPDPMDESRYVLVQDKHSFGPKASTGTAYRIETRMVEDQGKTRKTSGVVWLGEIEIDSRGLLAGSEDTEKRNEVDVAVEVLAKLIDLGEGAVEIDGANKAGEAIGVSRKTMQRASRRLGLVYEHEGFGKDTVRRWRRLGEHGRGDTHHAGQPMVDSERVQHAESRTTQGDATFEDTMVDNVSGLSTMDSCEQCGASVTTLTVHGTAVPKLRRPRDRERH